MNTFLRQARPDGRFGWLEWVLASAAAALLVGTGGIVGAAAFVFSGTAENGVLVDTPFDPVTRSRSRTGPRPRDPRMSGSKCTSTMKVTSSFPARW